MFAFGFGGFGGMCTGSRLLDEVSPVELPAMNELNVKKVAVALWHALLITDEGRLYSIGRGRYGALGLGESDLIVTEPTPVRFTESVRVVDAVCGKAHSLCMTADGRVWQFGWVHTSESTKEICAIPQQMKDLFPYAVVQISAGDGHSACVTDKGKLLTWGMNHRFPKVIEALSGHHCVKVSCGSSHAVVLTKTGKTFAYGKIAQHEYVLDNNPKEVYTGHNWVDVLCGLKHTMLLNVKGEVHLCEDITAEKSGIHLVNTFGLQIVSVFSTLSSFGIKTNTGHIYTWGYNKHGNLGLGHKNYVKEPTLVSDFQDFEVENVFSGGYNVFCSTSKTSGLIRLLDSSLHHDVVVISGSAQIQAHKCVLSVRSKKCKELLKDLPSKELNLSELVPQDMLGGFLEFIYSNSTSSIPLNRIDVFHKVLLLFDLKCINSTLKLVSGNRDDMTNDLQNMFTNASEYYSDVSFTLDDSDSVIHAHKCILASRSEFFKAMFSTGMIESSQRVVKFQDANPDVFKRLLEYMYVDNFLEEISPEMSVALLELGARINWGKLRAAAEYVILKNLHLDNIADIIPIAEVCGAIGLRTAAINMAARNIEKLTENLDSIDPELIEEVKEVRSIMDREETRQAKNNRKEEDWLRGQDIEDVDRYALPQVGQGDNEEVSRILKGGNLREKSDKSCILQ